MDERVPQPKRTRQECDEELINWLVEKTMDELVRQQLLGEDPAPSRGPVKRPKDWRRRLAPASKKTERPRPTRDQVLLASVSQAQRAIKEDGRSRAATKREDRVAYAWGLIQGVAYALDCSIVDVFERFGIDGTARRERPATQGDIEGTLMPETNDSGRR
jgi:hypothetical protein